MFLEVAVCLLKTSMSTHMTIRPLLFVTLQEVSCFVEERWRRYEGQQCSIVTWSLLSCADDAKVRGEGQDWGKLGYTNSVSVDFQD